VIPDLSVTALTWAPYSGWACVLCGASLATTGGVSAGRAQGKSGAHDLSVEVYVCPPLSGCGPQRYPQTPAQAGLTGQGAPARAGHPHPERPKEIP
jgi:hypothetical protein